jgi:hypothetical protein
MEQNNRNVLVAVAAVVVGCCICAVVAVQRYYSVYRTSYLNLSSAALSRP